MTPLGVQIVTAELKIGSALLAEAVVGGGGDRYEAYPKIAPNKKPGAKTIFPRNARRIKILRIWFPNGVKIATSEPILSGKQEVGGRAWIILISMYQYVMSWIAHLAFIAETVRANRYHSATQEEIDRIDQQLCYVRPGNTNPRIRPSCA